MTPTEPALDGLGQRSADQGRSTELVDSSSMQGSQ